MSTLSSQDPDESRVLRKHIDRLANSLDPVQLSAVLYGKGIIEEPVWEFARQDTKASNYERCITLLGNLIRIIRLKPSAFEVFCEVLEQQEVTKDVAAHLREEVQKMTSKGADKAENDSITGNCVGMKRKASDNELEDKNSPCQKKLKSVLKQGPITDQTLMKIAWEVGERWVEVGVALNIDYKVLNSTIENDTKCPTHLKAFHMLQEWTSRAGDSLSYSTLAAALESTGLNTCAGNHCYTNAGSSTENEQ